MDFLDELEARVICGDGAIGTLLLEAGVPLERCFEELCVSETGRIRTIHEDYFAAGARRDRDEHLRRKRGAPGTIWVGETRGGNQSRGGRGGKKRGGRERGFHRGKCRAFGHQRQKKPKREVSIRKECFREQITALIEAGADLIFFETFTDFAEMEIAFLAKKEAGRAPEICSFACRPRWAASLRHHVE